MSAVGSTSAGSVAFAEAAVFDGRLSLRTVTDVFAEGARDSDTLANGAAGRIATVDNSEPVEATVAERLPVLNTDIETTADGEPNVSVAEAFVNEGAG